MVFSVSENKNSFPTEKSNRIVLFLDLRDSTEILLNFEQGIYQKTENNQSPSLLMRNLSATFTKPPIERFI